MMTERELYLFDVQGCLVVPGFLTAAEVRRLNEALDANSHRPGEDCSSNTVSSKTLGGAS